VDAAVAVGYAEAVTNPCCGNIGGGGFMVIRLQKTGREVFINFREKAPHAATTDMYLGPDGNPVPRASREGYRALTVPGTVSGLETALAHYGSLPRAKVLAPAIKLARDGFVLTRGDTDIIDAGASRLRADPEASKVFFHPDGSPLVPGDTLRQPALARTLEAIARGGPDAFYHGETAQRIDAAMHATGGLHQHGGRAPQLRLSRLPHRVCAPALLRRHHAVRDPADPVRLRLKEPRFSLRRRHPLHR
jgi:gamma-glutamyltranspeptidase/glutathione hydrolase